MTRDDTGSGGGRHRGRRITFAHVVSVPSQGEDAPSHRRPDDADRWPECGELATFHDVEVAESYGVFFVDVVKDHERAFACGACGELFDLKDTGIAAAAAAPTKARPKSPLPLQYRAG